MHHRFPFFILGLVVLGVSGQARRSEASVTVSSPGIPAAGNYVTAAAEDDHYGAVAVEPVLVEGALVKLRMRPLETYPKLFDIDCMGGYCKDDGRGYAVDFLSDHSFRSYRAYFVKDAWEPAPANPLLKSGVYQSTTEIGGEPCIHRVKTFFLDGKLVHVVVTAQGSYECRAFLASRSTFFQEPIDGPYQFRSTLDASTPLINILTPELYSLRTNYDFADGTFQRISE